MYINRTEPRLRADTATRRNIVRSKDNSSNGDSFSDTMASVLEIDVIEVSDSTEEEKKKQQAPMPQNKKQQEEFGAESTPKPNSLDIKV